MTSAYRYRNNRVALERMFSNEINQQKALLKDLYYFYADKIMLIQQHDDSAVKER
jgi:hypothetical protein